MSVGMYLWVQDCDYKGVRQCVLWYGLYIWDLGLCVRVWGRISRSGLFKAQWQDEDSYLVPPQTIHGAGAGLSP